MVVRLVVGIFVGVSMRRFAVHMLNVKVRSKISITYYAIITGYEESMKGRTIIVVVLG